jgi:hypothetical protein
MPCDSRAFTIYFGGLVAGHVEVAGAVVWQALHPSRPLGAQEEEFQLGARLERVAQSLRLLHGPAQHVARVAGELVALRREDVADYFGGGVRVQLPRDRRERAQVGLQVHVALVDARESFDGRAIEPEPILDRIPELMERNRHVLDDADDVGELQTDELDVRLLGAGEHLSLQLLIDRVPACHAR